jgi:hypothetical protein
MLGMAEQLRLQQRAIVLRSPVERATTNSVRMRRYDRAKLLASASYAESPMQREPYALARDKAGTYYFVDHGITEASAREFRLYRGPRGKLKPLAMKDVVSDPEGEISASTSGKLLSQARTLLASTGLARPRCPPAR